MKVDEAARLLGTTATTVRIGLQQGVFPFGVAFKTAENRKHYTYIIYPEKLKEYAGERKQNGQDQNS